MRFSVVHKRLPNMCNKHVFRISRIPDACNSNSVTLIHLYSAPRQPSSFGVFIHIATADCKLRHPSSLVQTPGPTAKESKAKSEGDLGQDLRVYFRLQAETSLLLMRLTWAFFSILRVPFSELW